MSEQPERKRCKRQANTIDTCMLCDKGCEEGSLHQVQTFDADTSIRAIVTELQGTHKVSDIGDLIAKEAKYHLKCLV